MCPLRLKGGSAKQEKGWWIETCVRCRTGMWRGDKIILNRVTYILRAGDPATVRLSLLLGALVPAARVRSLYFGGAGSRSSGQWWR
jgi:hypothetical protein